MRKDVQKLFDCIHGEDDALRRAVNEARENKEPVVEQNAPMVGIKPGDHLLVQVKGVNGQGGADGQPAETGKKKRKNSSESKKPGQRLVSFWVDDITYKRLGYIKVYTGKLFDEMYNIAVERYVEEMEQKILGASTND